METHKYKENPLSPGNCIACGLNEYSWRHSNAPENKSIISLEGWESVKLSLEAPIDEGWEEQLNNLLADFERNLQLKKGAIDIPKTLKSFIASLLQKEREELRAKAYKLCNENEANGFKLGKSEAFSLVRKILKKLQDNADYTSVKGMGYREAVKEISLELSTLEGGTVAEGKCAKGHTIHYVIGGCFCECIGNPSAGGGGGTVECCEKCSYRPGGSGSGYNGCFRCPCHNKKEVKLPRKLQANIGWSPEEEILLKAVDKSVPEEKRVLELE